MNTSLQPNQVISWQDCLITSKTNLDAFAVKSLVTLNGQPILRQHEATYLTGKDNCRAHHFAKFLAASVLSGSGDSGVTAGRVLWIDTVHGLHICAGIYRELSAHVADEDQLHILSLDALGTDRNDFLALIRIVEAHIRNLEPDLVIIDDIDHFMPFCGMNAALGFSRIVHNIVNNMGTAFLFIGYNHLGKKASTTGNLGKFLFRDASNVFSVITQGEVTTVRLVRSYDLSRNPDDTQYHFTIAPDNMPCVATAPAVGPSGIDDATLRAVICDILQPGDTITADELLKQVTLRLKQMKRQRRSLALLDQALSLGLLTLAKEKDGSDPTGNENTDTGDEANACGEGSVCEASSMRYTLKTSEIDDGAKDKLTLPTPLNTPTDNSVP